MHHDIHIETHPPEPKLAFPSRDRELTILRGPVARQTAGDGGQFIYQMSDSALDLLFDEARHSKHGLATRLGADADGRRWYALEAKDFASMVNEKAHRRAAGVTLSRYLGYINSMHRMAARSADWFTNWLDGRKPDNFDSLTRSASAFRRDVVQDVVQGLYDDKIEYTPLGWSICQLYSLVNHHERGNEPEVLDLLQTLPQAKPDAEGKVARSVRTMKWLKKYLPLVQAWDSYADFTPDGLDKAMSALVDGLSAQRVWVCVSVNPLDFILSASRNVCDFTSCHSLDGMHFHGNVSYARDNFTALVFLDREGPERGFPFFKTGRAWVYVGDQDQILVGQLYGRGMSGHVINQTLRQIEQTLRPGARWRARSAVPVQWDRVRGIGGYGSSHMHTHYPGFLDAELTRMAAPLDILATTVRVAVDSEEDEAEVELQYKKLADVFPVLRFEDAFCLNCETDIDRMNRSADRNDSPFCGHCLDSNNHCSECGCAVHPDDTYSHADELYCEECFSRSFTTCDHCGATECSDEMRRVYQVNSFHSVYSNAYEISTHRIDICASCFEDEAWLCEVCDEWHINGRNYSGPTEVLDSWGDARYVCPASACQEQIERCSDCGTLTLPGVQCPDQAAHDAEREAEQQRLDQAATERLAGSWRGFLPVEANDAHTTQEEVTHA